MVRSLTLVCPGGLIRTSHISRHSRFLYSCNWIPEWLRLRLLGNSLEPRSGAPSAEVPKGGDYQDVDFDDVPIAVDQSGITVGDVIRWQLRANKGFIQSYLSTIRSALVYRRHDKTWRVLAEALAHRRIPNAPTGLPNGQICLVLAERDITVVTNEFLEDSRDILGVEDVDLNIMRGGHEVGILQGKDVASIAMHHWSRQS